MHIDLPTLYLLAVGTLLVSAGLTLWELHGHPERRQTLGGLAAAYICIAVGCLLATSHDLVLGAFNRPCSNLIILSGYLLILDAVASLSGRHYRRPSIATVAAMAALWAFGGVRAQNAIWDYASAFPIAVACGATAIEVGLARQLRDMRSRHVVVVVSGCHALLYAARALILPILFEVYGLPALKIAAAVTMYGGVLYSVVLPMALLAMIREEAHNRLLTRSRTDYLTGLGNREWFFEQGARLVDRTDRPLSLLAFDLDHFKAINDRHGHAIGDEVLKSFATAAHGIVGSDTILARIGGEEFAALLPGCDGGQARRIAQAIAERFAATVTLTGHGMPVRTTVSIGVAEQDGRRPSLAALLANADMALYAAKARGRNRIASAGEDPQAARMSHCESQAAA
ncbi:GGDEF domain-containing protein [Sphingomonas nostoxanthinifaciens]|uniref:GGDEF domain-containing protein n=1 Tax=Sphingomonas nostoxanthinifaciens TaxID=2872652 RepID=UPI001CC1E69A|nr:GGDEF domain-containing protein [Sphingomonas nostoxanthinifaciens]UAK24029.1 GGDEF domain-containing protein [Sphingomonas nostoxanthinifaciens]